MPYKDIHFSLMVQEVRNLPYKDIHFSFMVQGVSNLPYEGRLKWVDLHSLARRRL